LGVWLKKDVVVPKGQRVILFTDEAGIYAEVQLTCPAEQCDEAQKRKIVKAILCSPDVKKAFSVFSQGRGR
jgi:hypothetical protein